MILDDLNDAIIMEPFRTAKCSIHLDLRRAHEIVDKWPSWKRELADKVLRPSIWSNRETKNGKSI